MLNFYERTIITIAYMGNKHTVVSIVFDKHLFFLFQTPFLPNRAPEEKAVFGAITIMTENYTTFYNHAVRNFIISKVRLSTGYIYLSLQSTHC